MAALRAVYWRLAAQMDEREPPPQPQPPQPQPQSQPQSQHDEAAAQAEKEEDGRVGNALFLSFELEQLFEDLALERAAPPPDGSALLDGASWNERWDRP